MKIKAGEKLDEIELPEVSGNIFKLSGTKGKRVLLTFYRVAGCSFCNLRLMEFKKNSEQFGDNFVHVGIFHSPIDNLKRTMNKHGEMPFTILADEHFKYFKKYEVERSISKLLMTLLLKSHKIFPAILKGWQGKPAQSMSKSGISDIQRPRISPLALILKFSS